MPVAYLRRSASAARRLQLAQYPGKLQFIPGEHRRIVDDGGFDDDRRRDCGERWGHAEQRGHAERWGQRDFDGAHTETGDSGESTDNGGEHDGHFPPARSGSHTSTLLDCQLYRPPSSDFSPTAAGDWVVPRSHAGSFALYTRHFAQFPAIQTQSATLAHGAH